MKKNIATLMLFLMLCVFTYTAQAAAVTASFSNNDNIVTVQTESGTKHIEAPAQMFAENGTMLVPLRTVADIFGYEIYWNGENQSATVIFGDNMLVFRCGDNTASKNTAEYTLGVAPTIKQGAMYVPLRFIAEMLGNSVEWNESDGVAVIRNGEATSKNVPIIMYHDIRASSDAATVVTVECFERNMRLISENGYTPISFSDMISFVEGKTLLPRKPVVITFDDGYYSNYQYAFPILCKYGYKATIFVIGSLVGRSTYYQNPLYATEPHFGIPEIMQMTASGLIDIQSHTFNMHRRADFEPGSDLVRESAVPFENESEREFAAALVGDILNQNLLFSRAGIPNATVLSFPNGKADDAANRILFENGYRATLTTDPSEVNTIEVGNPQTLINLGRFNITENTTDDMILSYLKNNF